MIERLAEDHVNARRLADGLASMPGVSDLDPTRLRTNFVIFRVPDRRAVPRRDRARGRAHGRRTPTASIRAVTHYGIEATDIDRAIATVAGVLRENDAPVAPRS